MQILQALVGSVFKLNEARCEQSMDHIKSYQFFGINLIPELYSILVNYSL